MAQREGTTFGPGHEAEAGKVAAAELILLRWACGDLNAKGVHKALREHGVRLLDRLNPAGLPMVDAEVEGWPEVVTLTF